MNEIPSCIREALVAAGAVEPLRLQWKSCGPGDDFYECVDARGLPATFGRGGAVVERGEGPVIMRGGKPWRTSTQPGTHFVYEYPRRWVNPNVTLPCTECGDRYALWMTDDEIWKRADRVLLRGRPKYELMLCVPCFLKAAPERRGSRYR